MRYRKSINLGGGVRLNLNKKSVGLSAGGKGLRYSVNSSGRRTRTVSVPGTGVSWRSTSSSPAGGRGHAAPPARSTIASTATAPRPGLFAPKAEKQLYKALQQAGTGVPMEYWAPVMLGLTSDPKVGVAASVIAGVVLHERDPQTALSVISPVLAPGIDPRADSFLSRYGTAMQVTVALEGIPFTAGLSRDLVALVVCQLHNRAGEYAAAMSAAQAMVDGPWPRAMRAALALDMGDYAAVLALTDNTVNVDDLAMLRLVLRAQGLRGAGHPGAAVEVLKDALRFPSRLASLRHRALFERAQNFIALGQPAKARADLDRLLAEDASYPGIREALAGQ